VSKPDESARKGNLLGVAMVVGLFAFFVADAMPAGFSAVVAFFVAGGGVVLLFLLPAVVVLAVRWLSAPDPIRSRARATARNARRVFARAVEAQGRDNGAGKRRQQSPMPSYRIEVAYSLISGARVKRRPDRFAELRTTVDRLLRDDADGRLLTDLVRYVQATPEERKTLLEPHFGPGSSEQSRAGLLRLVRLFEQAPEPLRARLLGELHRRMDDR